MKRLPLIIFTLYCFHTLAQQSDASAKRNTFGYFFSPGAITGWTYDNLSINSTYSKTPNRVNYTPPGYGLSYNCRLNYLFTFHGAIYTGKEHFKFDAITNQRGNLYIDYKVAYLRLPVGLRLYLTHGGDDNRPLGGCYIQATGNFDYISQEDIYTKSSEFIDPASPPPAGYVSPPPVVTETHSSKLRFNRICPAISIGQEIVGNRTSFFYGGEYEFESVYQERNTQEYFRNWKFYFFNVGFGYRF